MLMETLTRKQAKQLGLPHYFTGKPCARGGIGRRLTVNGTCLCELCQSFMKGRLKEYREKNSERLAAEKVEWYRENAKRISEKNKKNRSRISAIHAAWVAKNADRIRERAKQYNKENRDKKRNYRKEKSAEYAAHCANRRARKQRAVPCWFSELDELVQIEAASLASLRSAVTGIQWSVDHMIPLNGKIASGLHCADNLQVIPAIVNSWKANRFILTERASWTVALSSIGRS